MDKNRNMDMATSFVDAIPPPRPMQRDDHPIYDAGRKYSNAPVDGRTLAGLLFVSLIVGAGFGWFALMVSGQKPLAVLVAFGILAGFMWHMRDSITGDRLALRESDNKRREEDARTAAWERVEKLRLAKAGAGIEAWREVELQRISMQQTQIETNRQLAHSMKPTLTKLPESTFVSNVDQSNLVDCQNYLHDIYTNNKYFEKDRRLNNDAGWKAFTTGEHGAERKRMLLDGPIRPLKSGDTISGYGLVHAQLSDAINSLPSPTGG